MDKKGMSLGMTVVVVGLFLLIVFIVIAGAFGFGFKRVYDQAKEFLGFSDTQLEELKGTQEELRKASAEKKEEMAKRVAYMDKIVTDATDFLKAENYDKAIEQYLLYSKECKLNDYGCKVLDNGLKFGILNALRSKFYTSVLNNPANAENEYNEIVNLPPDKWPYPLIKSEDYEWNYFETKILALISRGEIKKADELSMGSPVPADFKEIYNDFDFFAEYMDAIMFYIDIKFTKDAKLCPETLAKWDNLIEKSSSALFTISDYPFISKPRVDIVDNFCS